MSSIKPQISSSFSYETQEEVLDIPPKSKPLLIGIPKEIAFQENRIGLIPEAVSVLVAQAVNSAKRSTEISPNSVAVWENLATMYENAAALVLPFRGFVTILFEDDSARIGGVVRGVKPLSNTIHNGPLVHPLLR